MDAYAQAQASTVRQALAVEGGHLCIGPNGAVLHFNVPGVPDPGAGAAP